MGVLTLLVAPAHAVTVCPGPDAVYGIDVSEFQGNINWPQVKAAGKEFAIIRVSDGSGYLDKKFDINWPAAKAAGVIRGVYQFFEPGEDAVAQANLLLNKMGPIGPDDLPPMIDVEVTGGQSPSTITSKIHQWVDTVQARTGRKPLVYTGGWFWNPKVQTGDFTSYPLVDSYYCSNCCPDIATPWSKWAMWQYSSTGSVPGISGNVDLDRFDGNLAALHTLSGGSVDYAATYVSQSWPLASKALDMTVNQSIGAKLVLKNSGAKPWSATTRLGTTGPRDRASVFVAADWINDHRAAACTAGAAPGADCSFDFTLHAPTAPGDYHEHFTLVEEGVAWFSDAGQGGPADNQIEAWIHVAEANYHGEFVKQSYPLAPAPTPLVVGQQATGWIELKNVGTLPWKAGETYLAPTPRDMASSLAAPDWHSPTRVATLEQDVAPGAVGHFALSLLATEAGERDQTFSLVEEGITWFADAPAGGGPVDDLLRVHVVATVGMSGAPDAGAGHGGADGGTSAHGDGGVHGDGGTHSDGGAGLTAGGCDLGAGRAAGTRASALMLLGLVLSVLSLRRRRA